MLQLLCFSYFASDTQVIQKMRVLLIDERQSPFSTHLARAIRYQNVRQQMWWVQRSADVTSLSPEVLEFPPDLIIVVNDETEPALRRILTALQENTRTISRPVLVVNACPLSDELLSDFSVQIKAAFVTPFSIEEFLTTLQQFTS